jgi:hypothetical protein
MELKKKCLVQSCGADAYGYSNFCVHHSPKDLPEARFRFVIQSYPWRWDVFGDGITLVTMSRERSWFYRLITKLLLGSRWERT